MSGPGVSAAADGALRAMPDTGAHAWRRWWRAAAGVLVAGLIAEAAFTGAMLSGEEWAREAHAVTAIVLVAASLVAGMVAGLLLCHVRNGPALALTLLGLGVVTFAQMATGKMAAGGANLLWLHVPLGVALVWLATQAVMQARRLGG